MAGRELNKSIQDHLKHLFKKGASAQTRARPDFVITDDIQRQMGPEAPITKRLKIARELADTIMIERLDDCSIVKVWKLVEDLFNTPQPIEVKVVVYNLLMCLIKGQYERLRVMRAHFFRIIKAPGGNQEDVSFKFDLLSALTEHGKDILYFEEDAAPFLIRWFPAIKQATRTSDFFKLFVNLIKFNAAYVEDQQREELIKEIYTLVISEPNTAPLKNCLEILDTIVAYSDLPSNAIPNYIAVLCRTVNIESHASISWKVMRNLLGTYMGHTALKTMCQFLQDPVLQRHVDLLRGTICFIQMGLWSDQCVTSLACPPSSVLSAIRQVARTRQPLIAFEIVTAMQQLIKTQGRKMHDPDWELVIAILTIITRQINDSPNMEPHKAAAQQLHETYNIIEVLIESKTFCGQKDQFYMAIEECAAFRPETSVFKLIDFLALDIIPIRHLWVSNLNNLLQKFFRQETRTNVKVKTISVLSKKLLLNRNDYEDELIERIVVPHLSNSSTDPDSIVRKEIVELLIHLCSYCETRRCLDLLDILEKFIVRPFGEYSPEHPVNEFEIADVKCTILGLINLFITWKIHRLPSNHATRIYFMLVTFLEHHYTKPKIFDDCNILRLKIFDCFLKMRADSLCHIGCPETGGKLKFSQYLCVTYCDEPPVSPNASGSSQQSLENITNVPLRRVFKIFITCLRQEKDWDVLNLVLQGIMQVLQNKSLILSKQGNTDLGLLVDTLSSMLFDKTLNLPDSLKSPNKPNRSDFNSAVLMVMANLASYHMYLDQLHQQRIVRGFVKYGLVHKCSKLSIAALTICTLEMRDVMVKLLPEVLLDLSKMTATVQIAVAVLEFLSTLTKLPTVYASFVGDQYMAVFAISLPYTNPFKYNHYVVSLAHHVIAVWFLKCRLPFRHDFISYITKGLRTNILVPFMESNVLRGELGRLNEDSSNRKRSSSLTEQSSRRRERASAATTQPDFNKHQMESTKLTFYEELTQTCIDLMARYTFSSCSALPRRSSSTEYLLNEGHSMTWFLGNKLITITTTGCSQKAIKEGLCDKCWNTCRFGNVSENVFGMNNEDATYTSHRNQQNDNATATSPLEENRKISDKLEVSQLAKDGANNTTKQLCTCWCRGWAEIYIRRATGDISWIMRLQNQLSYCTMNDYPFSDLSNLYIKSSHLKNDDSMNMATMSTSGETVATKDDDTFRSSSTGVSSASVSVPISIPSSPHQQSPSRQNSRDSIEEAMEDDVNQEGGKSRNPVRRSNSSPEMSASWKNPFLQKQERIEREEVRIQEDEGAKKTKTVTKDMRVSCEAIPEEISGMGTTPPSNESAATTTTTSNHPTLWSCHSYPGSAPPAESQASATKSSHTVPPSPNIIQGPTPPLTLSLAHTVHSKPMVQKMASLKSDALEGAISEKTIDRATLPNLPPLAAKPPQSPTQTSPRLAARHVQHSTRDGPEVQKSSSPNPEQQKRDVRKTPELKHQSASNPDVGHQSSSMAQRRDRGYTISVMNTTTTGASRRPRLENLRRAISTTTRPRENLRSGMNPSFVFLQLYHSSQFGHKAEKPLLVNTTPVIQRALKVLDCIPPYETHRIGVLCVRQGQCNNEVEILRNSYGSARYTEFLTNLGSVIKLKDVDSSVVFLGGLEQDGNDGKFTYIWQDDVIRVMFHIATMMPNRESDLNCVKKKMHIGNNNVTIVYNESGEDYDINTIKGQFNFACIIVEPLDYKTNRVTVKAKDELIKLMGETESKIVSDQNVALLARQLALHADLASLVSRSLKSQSQDPYASNWLERLRQIKSIQTKVMQEMATAEPRGGTLSGPGLPSSSVAPSTISAEEIAASNARYREAMQIQDFTEYT